MLVGFDSGSWAEQWGAFSFELSRKGLQAQGIGAAGLRVRPGLEDYLTWLLIRLSVSLDLPSFHDLSSSLQSLSSVESALGLSVLSFTLASPPVYTLPCCCSWIQLRSFGCLRPILKLPNSPVLDRLPSLDYSLAQDYPSAR
jgi:hypothetical protein